MPWLLPSHEAWTEAHQMSYRCKFILRSITYFTLIDQPRMHPWISHTVTQNERTKTPAKDTEAENEHKRAKKGQNTLRINTCLIKVYARHDPSRFEQQGQLRGTFISLSLFRTKLGLTQYIVHTGEHGASHAESTTDEKSILHRVQISPSGSICGYSLESSLFQSDSWCLARPSGSSHMFRRGSHMSVRWCQGSLTVFMPIHDLSR